MSSHTASPLVFLLASLLLAGCQSGGPVEHPVKGRVTKGGQPLPVKQPGGNVRVLFVPIEGNKEYGSAQANVNAADGTFSVPGRNTKGLPAGKYKVCVTWKDYEAPTEPDKLGGQFNEKNSKIVREVPAPGDIDIDVGKPGG